MVLPVVGLPAALPRSLRAFPIFGHQKWPAIPAGKLAIVSALSALQYRSGTLLTTAYTKALEFTSGQFAQVTA